MSSQSRGWADWLDQSRVMLILQNLYIYRVKPNITRDPAMPDAVRHIYHEMADQMWSSLLSYMRQLLETLDDDESAAAAPSTAPPNATRAPAQLPTLSRIAQAPAPIGMVTQAFSVRRFYHFLALNPRRSPTTNATPIRWASSKSRAVRAPTLGSLDPCSRPFSVGRQACHACVGRAYLLL